MNHTTTGNSLTGPYTTSVGTQFETNIETNIMGGPVPVEVSNMWKIFKPTEITKCFWCDESLNPLSALDLHNPETIPYISYEIVCDSGHFTVRRDHKDNLLLKLEIGLGVFMVPIPKNVAKKFLKIMNRHQEDPEVVELGNWWEILPQTPQSPWTITPTMPYPTPTWTETSGTGDIWTIGTTDNTTDHYDSTNSSYTFTGPSPSYFSIRAMWNRLI